MEKSKLLHAASICTIVAGIACAITAAPVVIIFFCLVVSAGCGLIGLVGFFIGALIWLFSAGIINIFEFCFSLMSWSGVAFASVGYITNFCLKYFTPYVGWITVLACVAGIVLSIVAIPVEKRKIQQASAVPEPTPAAEPAAVPMPEYTDGRPRREKRNKQKKRPKRKKTNVGACILCIVLCAIFLALAIAALFVAFNMPPFEI